MYYYLTFVCNGDFGSCAIQVTKPVETFADIENLRNSLREEMKTEYEIVIINWVPLKDE